MSRSSASEPIRDPAASAKAAGLRYVTDTKPGISRKGTAPRFRYVDAKGKSVQDADTLGRIKSLVIPPAWTDVWICAEPKGHLQCTGRDARGRKQSRYHPHWREVRDETKYEHMLHFGAALPLIRERVEHDLTAAGLPKAKVIATIIRLMELTHIRVGNEEYAKQNHSYGLTTLRNKHVHVDGSFVTFKFKGKSGVLHAVDVTDRRLSKIVQRCYDIPGHELFQYVDKDGTHHGIDSADVNDYLREITGQHFTAKDFRTWAGSLLASTMLQEFAAFESESQAKKNVIEAIKQVAARLGNTPSVCRKCYVHPSVLNFYMSGNLVAKVKKLVEKEAAQLGTGLHTEERELLKLLKKQVES